MLAIIVLVVIGSTIWVGFDASGRDFSDCRTAHSTFEWVAACLLLWIVFFPAYLAQRGHAPLRER
jgi:hypothetical protein